ncbi:alpha/beta hydrolase [Pedobacter nutrimenti]|uniref:alpha/beta fold hydrolase n=1 Tax=Pedobacter nutrimenti TaxID=1241337 RepID=UPI00292DDD27|nr:alpha/beta hydrolase [Pedobacter nutrimenti]
MKLFKRILKFTGIALLALLTCASFYFYNSGPEMPPGTDALITKVLESPLPEQVKGKTGFAKSHGLNIWYESIAPKQPAKGAVLLIMGISNDALGWPPQFISALVDSGYQVIRYDHRGTGESDWVKNWNSKHPYSLADMADDGVSVLNSLGVRKADVVGISMGGMIAQELAINHPDRVATLNSIMSSGYIEDPTLPPISSAVAWDLVKVALKYGIIRTDRNMIKMHIASRIILKGKANYPSNSKELAEQVLYDIRKRKGYNSDVSRQHQAAVFLSGSRYDKLKKLSMPTLVVHGREDPFIPIAHGKKCAAIIPMADSLWVENMGHDLPNNLIGVLTKAMIANFHRK